MGAPSIQHVRSSALSFPLGIIIAFTGLVTAVSQGCSPATFNGGSPQPSTSATPAGDGGAPEGDVSGNGIPACSTVLQQITTGVKILFVIDTSGSNAGFHGTDPLRRMRAGSLRAFLGSYGDKTNFAWGFLIFSGTTATPLIANGGTPVFSDRAAMQTALTAFEAKTDSGNTPYLAALDMATLAINLDNGPNTDKYIVVFMSDGMPNPDVADHILGNAITQMIGSKAGQVTFNAVYYGPGDPLAANLLATMVQLGNGVFLDTNANPTGKDFQIDDVINLPGQNCRNLSQVSRH